MRKLFPGSYPPKDEDFKLLWDEGMFVFDTNMLLNFYRYSEETRKEFLDLVSSPAVVDRIWIPHQVALEYHRNLDEVRYEQVAACIKMRSSTTDWAKSLRAGDHKTRADRFLTLAEEFVTDAENQYRHPDRQALIERIADLFEGKVGPEWDEKRLSETYKEGEKRYAQKIPPGFEDASRKKGDDRFGDLVLWRQIIDEATSRKKPVILVTDDVKEDWWLRVGGKTVGPLPALRNEIHRKAGVLFHMYSGDRFLEQARSSLKRPVREETVAEVKQVREEQQKQTQEINAEFEQSLDFLRKMGSSPHIPNSTMNKQNPEDIIKAIFGDEKRSSHAERTLEQMISSSSQPTDPTLAAAAALAAVIGTAAFLLASDEPSRRGHHLTRQTRASQLLRKKGDK